MEKVQIYLPQVISSVLVLLLFLVIIFIVGFVFDRVIKVQNEGRKNILIFLRRLSRIIIIIFGLVTLLGTWGVDVSALVAGLGLTGFALGFALKDAVSSILSGILVLLYEPFKIGDMIKICGVEGKVVAIDMRYTSLKDGKTLHLIPNAKLFTDKVSIM